MEKPVKRKTWDLLFRGKIRLCQADTSVVSFRQNDSNIVYNCCWCVCVCVFVCLFLSTVKASPDWTERWMYCQIYRPAMLCWGNYCVKNFCLHILVNHSRDLLASNCARVSLKLGRAMRSKRQLLKLSKNQQ